jgi:hypothetical protein
VANHCRSNAGAIPHPLGHAFAGAQHGPAVRKEPLMLDVIMLAIGLGFFALSVGYTIACDRL